MGSQLGGIHQVVKATDISSKVKESGGVNRDRFFAKGGGFCLVWVVLISICGIELCLKYFMYWEEMGNGK